MLMASVALASAVGCEELLDVADYGVAEPPPAPAFHFAESACRSCSASHCSDQLDACLGDPACFDYQQCLFDCAVDDSPCRSVCFFTHRPPDASTQLDACVRGQCLDDCAGRGGHFRPRSEACGVCVDQSCGEQVAQCLTEPACDAAKACIAACTDPDCKFACLENAYNPGALNACARLPPEVQLYARCYYQSCATACSLGTDWACVGNYSWGGGGRALERWFRVVELANVDQGIAGVEVAMCAPYDRECENPLDLVTSDENGDVCVQVEEAPGVNGFHGYFRERHPDDGFSPYIYMRDPFSRPFGGNENTLLTRSQRNLMLSFLGVAADPTRSMLVLVAFDCSDALAEGIRFEVEPSDGTEFPFYFRGGLPDGTATSTDSTGVGGFVNAAVSEQPVTVRAYRASDDQLVAERSVVVLADEITAVSLSPLSSADL